MSKVTRRRLLGGAAATAGGAIATAIPLPAPAATDEQSVSPQARLHAAVEELKAAAAAVYPSITHWDVCIGDEIAHCPVLIASFGKKASLPQVAEYNGPGFYTVAGKRPDGGRWECTLWLERVDYKTVPGFYYRAESWWKGRLEYARRLKPGAIRIISKDDDYATVHGA